MTEEQKPSGPSMDSKIVRSLFLALACAAKKPGTFEVESRNETGMQGITVLTLDSNIYEKLMLPILTHLNLAPIDVTQ